MDLDLLLPRDPAPRDSWRWATVTAVSPLRVRLDGESEPLAATPDLLAPVGVGDRVWCQLHGRRVVVHPQQRGPVAVAAGRVSTGAIGAGQDVVVSVTFPVGRFTTGPIVTSAHPSSRVTIGVPSVDQNGATLRFANWTTTAAGVSGDASWLAVQMTPTDGAG